MIGLGLERPLAAEDVAGALAPWRHAGVARFFVHLHPDARTDAAVAGDPRHADANSLRCGFEGREIRANGAPPRSG